MEFKDEVDLIIEAIYKNFSKPYIFYDQKLAEQVLTYIQKFYPTIFLIKYGSAYCLIASQEAKESMLESLHISKMAHQQSILEIEKIISTLQTY